MSESSSSGVLKGHKVPLSHIEKLIIKEANHNYYHAKANTQYDRKPRIDGIWTVDEVYDAFVDHPLWCVKKHNDEFYEHVSFRERREKQTEKKNWHSTMMLIAHYITKHTWKLSQGSVANLVIYGGFARSAMIAWHACKCAVYTTILCCKLRRVPRDVYKMILTPVLDSWFDDFTWFQDKVRDIDILVSYHPPTTKSLEDHTAGRYTPGTSTAFYNDVNIIVDILAELCKRTPECVYEYTPYDYTCERANLHREGQTSHRSGNFFNYLVSFYAPPYVGKKVTRNPRGIHLDITTMIANDTLDADVNNLVLYFDHKRQSFRFGLRKKVVFPSDSYGPKGPLTLKQIESQVARRQFRPIPLDPKSFHTPEQFEYAKRIVKIRLENLEYRGWERKGERGTSVPL
jgi:hypothetical protein